MANAALLVPPLARGTVRPLFERGLDVALRWHLMKATADPESRALGVCVLVGNVGGVHGMRIIGGEVTTVPARSINV